MSNSRFVEFIIAALVLSSGCGVTLAADDSFAIGMNLNRITDYNPTWVFTDVFKHSRPWISMAYNAATGEETWSDGGPVETDSNGWPLKLRTWKNADGQLMQQRLGTLMFREIGDKYPSGVYYAEWEGSGRVEWGFAARVIRQGVTQGKNFAELNVTPSEGGIHLKISTIDPNDPIRNIHVWMPDYDNASFRGQAWKPGAKFSPFHPLFKERLKPFSVLRFMDWTVTNSSQPHSWAERTPATAARQTGDGRGIAFEYIIALANELKKDVWINMPHAADDEYVSNAAKLFRDELDPDLKIYVEWSNELWNFAPGFAASAWLKQQVQLPAHRGKSNWEVAGREIKRDFKLWSDAFEGQADRIIRVIAGQAANSWIAGELARIVGIGNFDAFSVAAYVQLEQGPRSRFNKDTTADDILDAGFAHLPKLKKELLEHAKLCKIWSKKAKKEIPLVAYEAGQHFDAHGVNVPYLQSLYDAQTHPRMGELYRALIQVSKDANISIFNHYAFVGRNTPHGSWGALSFQDQAPESAPKFRELLDEIRAQ